MGETNLEILLKNLKPKLHKGIYVFCTVANISALNTKDILLFFKETEGITIILKKEIADELKLPYTFNAAWITLTVNSALDAVGLTASFSQALAQNNISCNVITAFYHDHVFVEKKDAKKAMDVLKKLSK